MLVYRPLDCTIRNAIGLKIYPKKNMKLLKILKIVKTLLFIIVTEFCSKYNVAQI